MLAKIFKILIAELNECPELFNLFLRRIKKWTLKSKLNFIFNIFGWRF